MDAQVLADCERFGQILRRFSAIFTSGVNNVLGRGRINLPQFNAVSAIHEHGGMTMTELARSLSVTMGAATNIVDKLVAAGMVTRDRGQTDRRVVNVRLTPSGERNLQEIRTSFAEFMSGIMEQVDPDSRALFLGACDHLIALAKAREAKPSPQ